jgi:transcriptional regulator with XRE-family HTH domain
MRFLLIGNFNIMENSEIQIFNLCVNRLQEQKGWSIAEIAAQLNVTQTYLSSVKNGKKKLSPKLLYRARKISGMTTQDIIDEITMTVRPAKEVNEPASTYETKSTDKDIFSHLIYENTAKSAQIDKLILELSKATTTISILANKIKS